LTLIIRRCEEKSLSDLVEVEIVEGPRALCKTADRRLESAMEREKVKVQRMQGFQLAYMAFVKVSSLGMKHTMPIKPVGFRWRNHLNCVDTVEHDALPCEVRLVEDYGSFWVFI
jgi:hypothetical protein